MKFRGGGATRKTAPDSDLTLCHFEDKDNLSPKIEEFYEKMKCHSGLAVKSVETESKRDFMPLPGDLESINVDNRLRLGGRSDEGGKITQCSFRHSELDSESINADRNRLRLGGRSDESSQITQSSSRHSELDSESINANKNRLHFDSKSDEKSHNPAFTLAEVLITLGIIGIVAAMTLPSLINNSKHKELEGGLKKNYSVIQQAFDMYFAENGYRLKANSLSPQELKSLIIKYFSVLRDCGFGSNQSDACIPSYEIAEDKYKGVYKTYNGGTMRFALIDDGQFVLTDGSLILLENSETGPVYISVDVNGYNKNPNRWGHDLFTFQLTDDGKILPMGAPGTTYNNIDSYCSSTSSHIYNGAGCTYKALTDKDYFKNLPK